MTQCRQQPLGIPSTKTMKEVVRDMMLLKASSPGYVSPDDSLLLLQEEAVLSKHGMTRAEYDSAMTWYAHNTHLLSRIYDELSSEFRSEIEKLDSAVVDSQRVYALHYSPAQSLWNGSSRLALDGDRGLYYSHQALSGVDPGDTLDFRAYAFPPLGKGKSVEVSFVSYDSLGVIKDRQRSLFQATDTLRASFIVPGSGVSPSLGIDGGVTYEFFLMYRDSVSTKEGEKKSYRIPNFMTLDSIALFKRLPVVLPKDSDALAPSDTIPLDTVSSDSTLVE